MILCPFLHEIVWCAGSSNIKRWQLLSHVVTCPEPLCFLVATIKFMPGKNTIICLLYFLTLVYFASVERMQVFWHESVVAFTATLVWFLFYLCIFCGYIYLLCGVIKLRLLMFHWISIHMFGKLFLRFKKEGVRGDQWDHAKWLRCFLANH